METGDVERAIEVESSAGLKSDTGRVTGCSGTDRPRECHMAESPKRPDALLHTSHA